MCARDCVQLSTRILLPDVSLFDFTALPMCWLLQICAVMCARACVYVTAGPVWVQCYLADPSHLLWVRGIKENPGSALDQ